MNHFLRRLENETIKSLIEEGLKQAFKPSTPSQFDADKKEEEHKEKEREEEQGQKNDEDLDEGNNDHGDYWSHHQNILNGKLLWKFDDPSYLNFMDSDYVEGINQLEHCQTESLRPHIAPKSTSSSLVYLHQTKIYQNEAEQKDKQQLDITNKTILELIKLKRQYSLSIYGQNIRSDLHIAVNKLHLIKTIFQIEADRKMMAKTAQCYYALTCYHLSKLSQTSFIDLSLKKNLEQYVREMEEDLMHNTYAGQIKQDANLKIYLHKTQSTILDQCLRQFRIYCEPARSNKIKWLKALSKQQEEELLWGKKTSLE